MHIPNIFKMMKTVRSVETVQCDGSPTHFHPEMFQGKWIQEADTGRYILSQQQVAYNSAIGGGTLGPNSPKTINEQWPDFADQFVGDTRNGTLPNNTLRTQPLIKRMQWVGDGT